MNHAQFLQNLQVPQGKIDVILDTDTYNEIDDQFALSYLLRSKEKLHPVAVYAAPFYNENSTGPADGMEKSYEEILKILDLAGEAALKPFVFRGSDRYLPDEKTPVESAAARDLCARAMQYSPEKPLYVVAIGAITNLASALLLRPEIKENLVIVWLGGHARHWMDTKEFNMHQDYAAARVVMGSGVPFVQLPCEGVVSAFTVSGAELERFLRGKNPLADYLAKNTIAAAEKYAAGKPWTRVIWDVTAVAWLQNDGDRFMRTRLVPVSLPAYDGHYTEMPDAPLMTYVYGIRRDALMHDLFQKLLSE